MGQLSIFSGYGRFTSRVPVICYRGLKGGKTISVCAHPTASAISGSRLPGHRVAVVLHGREEPTKLVCT